MGAELKDGLTQRPSKKMQRGGNGMAFRRLGTRRPGGSRPLDTGSWWRRCAREGERSCEPGPQFRGSRARPRSLGDIYRPLMTAG